MPHQKTAKPAFVGTEAGLNRRRIWSAASVFIQPQNWLQNWNRNSSDRIRGPRSLVYWPVDATVFLPFASEVKLVLTPLNSVWLKTLNASSLSLNWRFSLPIGIDRESEASKLTNPGPVMMPAPPPAFPMVPTAGSANAAGLNASPPLGRGGFLATFAFGLPAISNRAPSLVEPVIFRALVVPKANPSGAPVLAVVIPEICQPSVTMPSNLLCIACPGFGKS